MSGTWSSSWVTGDIVTAAEFRKGTGCVADSTLGVAAASFDFTGLPTSYAHLVIECWLRGDAVATVISPFVRLNNDSGANYTYQRLTATNATVASAAAVAQTSSAAPCEVPAASAPASEFGYFRIAIPNYASTSGFKVMSLSTHAQFGATAASVSLHLAAAGWKSTAAVNRVTILPSSGNFAAGSRVSVYARGS